MKQPFVKYLSLGLCLLPYTAHQAQNNTTNSTNEAWQDTPCTNLLPGDAAGDTGCVTFVYGGQNVTYRTVRAADGKVWLQQNLGSTQVATSKEDEAAYGDVFQWGRWDDGHQKRNSTVIPAAPTPNNPLGVQTPTNGYIAATTGWWSGANMQLTDLWTAETPATVTATNGCDPCAGSTGCVTFVYGGQTITYTTVRGADGNIWLQQNLGSSQVATSVSDALAYGDLFQWGRWEDGHQKRNSATIASPTPNNPFKVVILASTLFCVFTTTLCTGIISLIVTTNSPYLVASATEVALIVAVPLAIAVTTPVALTDALAAPAVTDQVTF